MNEQRLSRSNEFDENNNSVVCFLVVTVRQVAHVRPVSCQRDISEAVGDLKAQDPDVTGNSSKSSDQKDVGEAAGCVWTENPRTADEFCEQVRRDHL